MSLQDRIKEFVEGYFHDYEEMGTEYAVFCPFHPNTDSPALYIHRHTGLWHCFNPACGAKGNFQTLLERLGLPDAEITFFGTDISVEEIITRLNDLDHNQVKEVGWQEALDKMTINYDGDYSAVQYLINRGFHPAVLQHFEIGYSVKQQRIVIPVRDINYKLVGFIGRADKDEIKPKYKYSEGLPRGGILFNLQNAKNYHEVIVAEGSLDAIKIHQAGFPNVVSTLGSTVTSAQGDLLNRYFDSIIIMTDNDDAGEHGKSAIISHCARKNLWIANMPDGKKDPGECSEDEIRESVFNKENLLDNLFKETYTKEKKKTK